MKKLYRVKFGHTIVVEADNEQEAERIAEEKLDGEGIGQLVLVERCATLELDYRYIAEWMIDHMSPCDGETAYDYFFASTVAENIYTNLDAELVSEYVKAHHNDIIKAIKELGRDVNCGYRAIYIFYTYEEKKQAGYYLNHPDEEEHDRAMQEALQ